MKAVSTKEQLWKNVNISGPNDLKRSQEGFVKIEAALNAFLTLHNLKDLP